MFHESRITSRITLRQCRFRARFTWVFVSAGNMPINVIMKGEMLSVAETTHVLTQLAGKSKIN